jgi:hypothetical protein
MMHHLFLGPLTLWTWEMESWGCRDIPEHHLCPPAGGKWWGRGVDVLIGCDRALATKGDTDHGWLRCSATGLGRSQDGKSFLYLVFWSSSCYLMHSLFFYDSSCNAYPGMRLKWRNFRRR